MSFIRINDERIKLSTITSYCEMQNMPAEEEAALSPYERERYAKIKHALTIFCDRPIQNTRIPLRFDSDAELQAALARLDAALPGHLRMNEWRMDPAAVVRVHIEEDQGRPTILLSTQCSMVFVREDDEAKRAEILARIDAKLETL